MLRALQGSRGRVLSWNDLLDVGSSRGSYPVVKVVISRIRRKARAAGVYIDIRAHPGRSPQPGGYSLEAA